jgi:hypothetical protein
MRNISHKISGKFLNEISVLERKGEYLIALESIREFWTDFNKTPDYLELEKTELAELFLRTGALIGFVGSLQQIPNSQEQSKNLLTNAREIYHSLFNFEKTAECENYLALAYWRMSAYSDAESWAYNSFSYNISEKSFTRLHTYIIQSLIQLSQKKYEDVIKTLKPLEMNFLENDDALLIGWFLMNLGLAFKNTEQNNKAIVYLLKARIALQESQNLTFLGAVENNLAQIYRIQKDFVKAHNFIDSVLSTVNDRRCKAVFLDTKALIYFDEEKYAEALETIEQSVRLLHGEDYNFLIDVNTTKIKILLALDKFNEAFWIYGQTFQLLTTYSDHTTTKLFTEDFYLMVLKNFPIHIKIYDEFVENLNIEFNLPTELLVNQEISKKMFAVRVNNNNLQHLGILSGMIVLANSESNNLIKNGDLVAVLQVNEKTTFLGFYDESFGIICVDRPNAEPIIFNKTEIDRLGKVIGYGFPRNNKSNKKTVKIKTLV